MAANHHLRLALDQVTDAVIIVEGTPLTGDGPRVLFANEALAAATGVEVQRLWNVPLGLLSGGELLLQMLSALAAAGGEVIEASAPLNHVQDQSRRCNWSVRRVHDGHGQTLNFILTATPDLSSTAPIPLPGGVENQPPQEAKKPEEPKLPRDTPPPAPEDWQQDLVETIRDTARFVAHEFNNALTAILLPVQLAIRQVPDGGDIHSNLQDAFESARRAADLAKDFLDCFRPRAPKRERCRLGSLLGRAVRLATCAQNIQCSLEVPDDLYDVEADSNQIERVIFNLVRNASQAMPNGGKIHVKANNTAVKAAEGNVLTPGHYVHISVRDWGPGIPEEHLPHLFHSVFTTKTDGNGCGLPICYQIVREHGGDMYVKSKVNVGTAFLLFLPALPAAAEVAVKTEAPAPVPPVSLPEPLPPLVTLPPVIATAPVAVTAPAPEPEPVRADPPALPALLVVDDEDGVRLAFSKIGKAFGFDVTTAATSEEGLQHYRDRLRASRPYDSVVVDINLRGGMNGFEVFEALRRISADVPVIATSGQCTESDLEKFETLGFAGFLPKPFTIEEFDEVMNDVLSPH